MKMTPEEMLQGINKQIEAGGERKAFAELMIAIINRFADIENRISKLENK